MYYKLWTNSAYNDLATISDINIYFQFQNDAIALLFMYISYYVHSSVPRKEAILTRQKNVAHKFL